MKRFILLIGLLGLMSMNFGCSKVPAGYKGVKVYLLGASKGVEAEELGPGRYWIGWNEELFLFPTFTQNVVWTQSKTEGSPNDDSITFQTREGMSVNTDLGVSYSVEPGMVAEIFQKYRKGIDEITWIYLRNTIRDAFVKEASSKPVEYVYGEGKAKLVEAVEHTVREEMKPIGINVERIYLVGDLRLPQQVLHALNAKIEATQRAEQRENEKREATAMAQKKIEEAKGDAESTKLRSIAQAEANKILSQSLTPALVQYRMIEKWDGMMPKISGGATPILDVNKIMEK